MVALTEAGGVAAAQHLAALAGGTFVPMVDEHLEDTDWHSLAADAVRKSATLPAELVESIGPGSPSPGELDESEARALLAHVDALMSILAEQHARLSARLKGS